VVSRRRDIVLAFVAVGAIVLAVVALRVVPVFAGPALPAGATRLHISTERPDLSFGCAAALLAPVRVAASGDELVLISVGSGDTARVVWPSGFAAWRVGGSGVIADPWGTIIGRDGDILEHLGGGVGTDDAFHICPYGLTPPAG
jgi:hypothetical protein